MLKVYILHDNGIEGLCNITGENMKEILPPVPCLLMKLSYLVLLLSIVGGTIFHP